MNIGPKCLRRLALLTAVASISPLSLHSQKPSLTTAAVGQIVDEVLRGIIPPDSSLSRVSIDKRKLFFDPRQTMLAFGYADTSAKALSGLRLQSAVRTGARELLSDCSPRGDRPCAQLGWSAYVTVAPVTVGDSTAVVKASVFWPDRGNIPFQDGVVPTGAAVLVGFVAEVHLIRGSDGRWRFARWGTTEVSD